MSSSPTASAQPLGVLETVRAVKSGTLSPEDAIAAAHAHAKTLDREVKAFALLPDAPSETAGDGPLAGVAVGVKDLIDTADMVTTYGSPAYADHVPARDADVVARIRSLSGTVLGKTVTTEFAWRHPGVTRNPFNLAHTPGGSSSGSAAAVGAGMVPLALGTQTLGSVIRPAAYCGVVGFKPSRGAISLKGVHPLSQSLDHLGLFTRSVDDAAYALSLLMGGGQENLREGLQPPPAFTVPLEGLSPLSRPRIALLASDLDRLEAPQRAVVLSAARRFADQGGSVEEITLPEAFAALPEISATLCGGDGAFNFADLVARAPDKTSERLKALVERGLAIPARDFIAAGHRRARLLATFSDVLSGFDALLCAPALGEAPEGLSDTGDPSLCVPWTTLGVPALTLPAGMGPKGLPLGIQLVGAARCDLHLLRAARWCEAALAFTPPAAPLA